MEINKIAFENLRQIGITQSFEDLDVNKDGVISDEDKVGAKSSISSAINSLLNAADDDAEIIDEPQKTGGAKDKYGINTTDAANFENDVTNSKGTTYVIMGNLPGCYYCRQLAEAMSAQLEELEGVANIYNMQWPENNSFCWDIAHQGGLTTGISYPQIAKFVDGKFVEIVSKSKDPNETVKTMIAGATGTPGTKETGETTKTDETSKTGETAGTNNQTSSLSEEDKAKLAQLKEQLAKINERIDEIKAEIKKLEERNAELKKEQEKLLKEQEEAQKAADDANQKFEEEQEKLESYTREYDKYQDEIIALNKEILKEQEREEDEFQSQMNTAVSDAVNNYDPKNDGDNFDAYFAKKMDSMGFPTFTKLNSLNWDAQRLTDEAEGVLRNIMSQSAIVSSAKFAAENANLTLADVNSKLKTVNDEIESNNTKITSLNTELTTKQTEAADTKKEINKIVPPVPGSGLTAAEVLSQISEQEKCFAKELGWKLEDCIIAVGQDGKFHIYNKAGENGLDGAYYTSSTRAYFKKTQGDFYAGESYNITPSGSGFLGNNINESENMTESEGGRAIYRFTCVNDDWTDGEVCESRGCYQTCSPLSFDVDGNGVNTTKETVSFDIDGDGELDTVNNSDEWVLAFDKDKDGIAGEDGSELFGNNTDLDGDGKADGYKDGFEALKALAKKEGLIGENDNKLDEKDIELLSKKYGLTMTNGYGGEAKSLIDLGIAEINLAQTNETNLEKNYDGRNNDIMRQEGATFTVNGETREYADIWNAKKDKSEAVEKEPEKPEKVEAQWGTYNQAKTNIKDLKLGINKQGVVALQGDVDFKFIKNRAENSAEAPDDILNEIIEVDELEEEEK